MTPINIADSAAFCEKINSAVERILCNIEKGVKGKPTHLNIRLWLRNVANSTVKIVYKVLNIRSTVDTITLTQPSTSSDDNEVIAETTNTQDTSTHNQAIPEIDFDTSEYRAIMHMLDDRITWIEKNMKAKVVQPKPQIFQTQTPRWMADAKNDRLNDKPDKSRRGYNPVNKPSEQTRPRDQERPPQRRNNRNDNRNNWNCPKPDRTFYSPPFNHMYQPQYIQPPPQLMNQQYYPAQNQSAFQPNYATVHHQANNVQNGFLGSR